MTDQVIQLEKVNKWYDDFHVLKDIDLSVDKGQKIVICGPSGSGKSTMIRCINRLEAHQEGKIVVHGTELTNDLKNIDLIRKNVGMVFQQFNLFPHLSVLDNIALAPIWVKKMPKKEAEEIAMSYLEKVKIPEQAEKFPGQLSGGQQQRVAIARSLAMNPDIMLFDEPTSALDPEMIKEVLDVMRRRHHHRRLRARRRRRLALQPRRSRVQFISPARSFKNATSSPSAPRRSLASLAFGRLVRSHAHDLTQ